MLGHDDLAFYSQEVFRKWAGVMNMEVLKQGEKALVRTDNYSRSMRDWKVGYG